MRSGSIKRILCLVTACVLVLLCAAPAAAAGPTRGKYAALTFDDGPNLTITPQLLDGLAERNVKCTFFTLGLYANLYPEIVQRAREEGHQIASHTYNHKILSHQTDATITSEVNGTREVLSSITGEDNFMVRLPYGDGYNNSRVLNCINAPVILWSVDPTNGKADYTTYSLYSGIVNRIYDGSIILLHDTSGSNMHAALQAIDTLQADGWTFVTVEELFRIKGVTPENNTVYFSVPDASTYFDEANLGSHWAHESINYVSEAGLMQGDGDGFKPNEYLTRAMALTILWRACGEPESEAGFTFMDVPEDSWYEQAVRWGVENGLINGYSETEFAPGDMVSREQFCTLIMRLAELEERQFSAEFEYRAYTDASHVSEWAAEAVTALWSAGFVSANETSAFRPTDSLTRAEAAEMLMWYKVLA